jgi:predicted RNase H-like nuclease (RuvC/YqgF family)
MDPRAVAEQVIGTTEAYDRATKTGEDIEIPIGRYAEFIAPTEHNEGLMRDVRLGSASAQTVNEMQAELQASEAMMDNMVKMMQSTEALQKQADSLDERVAALTQEVAASEARTPELQSRLESIRSQFQQTPAEQLIATLTGQTDSPESMALQANTKR